jgi:ABC-type spermidine/putrescine transport system permease subunit II
VVLNAFTRHAFREALAISVIVASIAAVLSTTIGTMAACSSSAGRFRGREL